MIDKAKDYLTKLTNIENTTKIVRISSIFIIVILILGIGFYIYTKMSLNSANCSNIESIYTSFPKISSFNPEAQDYKSYKLRDYYIKTAYNCCCSGQFKNDYVNVCALKNCVKQGARCLDFEIYSVNDEPVIATASINNFTTKEMYNSIPFKDALNIINDQAFSGSTCPNPEDPLLLHFRIMSNNKDIYKKMADSIFNTLESKLLDKNYSYEYSGMNLGAVSLNEFRNKVVIMVDKSNPLFESTPLAEYVNISTNSIFMRASRNYDIVYTPDMNELITYNKKNMTISMPDLSPNNTNISASLNMKYGVQMVGMNFQNFDSNMEYYDLFFDGAGSAFVLKPESLRFVPVTIPEPTPQKPEYSYAQRDVSSDYYSFKI
jgi:hypothetical protein